ncbi:MAG: hypothetical protein QMC80_02145 [Thermoplasmatales archaeon]|nr:hypothetical protein [Thermoplasmatales archaeon]
MQTPGNCMNDVMYEYHSHLLPEKIRSEKQRRWDKVLTEACNTCKDYSNYHDKNSFVLDDAFVEGLRIKMHITLEEDEYYEKFAAS